jgi:hypothetical protein
LDLYHPCAPLLFKLAQCFDYLNAAMIKASVGMAPQPFIHTIKYVHFGGRSPLLLTGFRKVSRDVLVQLTSLWSLSFSPARASEDEKRRVQDVLKEKLQTTDFNFGVKFSDMATMI